jgi:hypothetical protein
MMEGRGESVSVLGMKHSSVYKGGIKVTGLSACVSQRIARLWDAVGVDSGHHAM